ncbi:MAG: GNAT family N-acetyltransferase [Pirellulaceae bacterium]|nr:GNAT family N-acetyltransferase [Pirellulaceae bacterium]
MDEFHKEMTFEEYLTYPRKLGWKYEYYGDALHLSPSATSVAAFYLELDDLQPLRDLAAKTQRTNITIRQVERSDLEPLQTLFCESFLGSIDYADCRSADLLYYAQRSLERFFGSEPTEYLSACRVAVEGNRIVGGCLIDRGKVGPVLQPIYVAPSHQRRGIATELLLSAIQALTERSVTRMHSKCNLGNDASLAWHLRCGFTEIPNRWTAGHRANIYLQEAERQELLRIPTAPAIRELVNYWANQREQLEAQGSPVSEDLV